MDEQGKNMILATALSFAVIMVWFFLFPPEPPVQSEQGDVAQAVGPQAGPAADGGPAGAAVAEATEIAADIPRIPVETARVSGSISLQGGRIDDLKLLDYKETLDADSPNVTLLAPVGQAEPYFATYGWAPGGDLGFDEVPNLDTIWTQTQGDTLTAENPVVISWDNGNGLTFHREIALDEDYMFTVTQHVENTGQNAVRLAPHNEIVRLGQPLDLENIFVVHEGAIRQTGEQRTEYNWDDFPDLDADARWGANSVVEKVAQNGWIGFTDHFWMTMLVPASDQQFEAVFQYVPRNDAYKSITRLSTIGVEPGETAEVTTQFFAGAKEWELIRTYQNRDGIYEFLDTIDWGWFFFLTKPLFALLHWLNANLGNMGWAIIGLTLILKAILFPLAYRSYVSMAKMKELQPQMEALKERCGDDRQKMQQETMALYKKERVNPAAGCLPILLQIPIFFSLYKVIYVTIELRHAPWLGPFVDLSAPDPTSIMNIFGLLPFDGPTPGSIMALIFIGILPLLLGISMWLQQKLNPAPTDPTQQMIFAWMPWVFMFMLGTFASGLIVYWISNNVITFIQQYVIMRSQGYTPDVFGNIRAGFQRKSREPDPKAKPKSGGKSGSKAKKK